MIEVRIKKDEIDKPVRNVKFWQGKTKSLMVNELKTAAREIETKAKSKLDKNRTTDTGRLKSSGTTDSLNAGLTQVVRFKSNYAAHVEFGTRPHFPPLKPIKRWAKRKLGNGGAAFPVARKIAREGTKPKPFLFPAYEEERPRIINNLKKVLKRKK